MAKRKRKRKVKQIVNPMNSQGMYVNNNKKGNQQSPRRPQQPQVQRNTKAKTTQLKAGLSNPVISNSGDTAISANDTLNKVGNFVGKAAGIASKFLPGLGGTIAKGIADLFNDPEWWSSVPGQEVTCNEPLRTIPLGTLTAKSVFPDPYFVNCKAEMARPVITEFVSMHNYRNALAKKSVIDIKDVTMTQYVLPQIRDLMNAVPLQAASDYGAVLETNITIYALYKYVQKLTYLTKHGETYLPNFNTERFPLLQVENFSYLQSLERRLGEHLRASVRLPHTVCEYLAWRFGRIYKSNDSKKSTLIMYNPISLADSILDISYLVDTLLNFASTTQAYQKAQADIKEAFREHGQIVDIKDDTQMRYDKKEFMLRLNMDISSETKCFAPWDIEYTATSMGIKELNTSTNPVVIDSNLDNKTVFMASTVSTIDGVNNTLFPVRSAYCYRVTDAITGQFKLLGQTHADLTGDMTTDDNIGGFSRRLITPVVYSGSAVNFTNTFTKEMMSAIDFNDDQAYESFILELNSKVNAGMDSLLGQILLTIADQKAVDLYNVPVYVNINTNPMPAYNNDIRGGIRGATFTDISALSMDMGTVTETVLENEQVYAAANLLHMGRTHSESFKQAEKEVATDLANVIDKVDINMNA